MNYNKIQLILSKQWAEGEGQTSCGNTNTLSNAASDRHHTRTIRHHPEGVGSETGEKKSIPIHSIHCCSAVAMATEMKGETHLG